MPRVLFSLGAPCKEFFQPSRRRLAPASLPSPPAPPQPPTPEAPTSPRRAQPPPASAVFSSRPSQAASWSSRGSETTNTQHCGYRLPRPPSADPLYSSCSRRRRKSLLSGTPRPPETAPPPTCHPSASGFLPPPPTAAACQLQRNNRPSHWVIPRSNNSTADWQQYARGPPPVQSLKIPVSRKDHVASSPPSVLHSFSYFGQTPDAQMCGEKVHFQPPSCHIHLVQESVTQDNNVKFLLCFPAVRYSR